MPETKPCRICRRWFRPDPRAGWRQRVCSSEKCQRERRRRNAAAWREEHADRIEADRLREKLRVDPDPPPEIAAANPLAKIDPLAARIAVGLKTQVVLEEYVKVALAARRIAVPPKTGEQPRGPAEVARSRARIDTDRGRGPP